MNKKEVMEKTMVEEDERKGVIVGEITVATKRSGRLSKFRRYRFKKNVAAASWLTKRDVFKQQEKRRCFP